MEEEKERTEFPFNFYIVSSPMEIVSSEKKTPGLGASSLTPFPSTSFPGQGKGPGNEVAFS